jgi:hypothetical protein
VPPLHGSGHECEYQTTACCCLDNSSSRTSKSFGACVGCLPLVSHRLPGDRWPTRGYPPIPRSCDRDDMPWRMARGAQLRDGARVRASHEPRLCLRTPRASYDQQSRQWRRRWRWRRRRRGEGRSGAAAPLEAAGDAGQAGPGPERPWWGGRFLPMSVMFSRAFLTGMCLCDACSCHEVGVKRSTAGRHATQKCTS